MKDVRGRERIICLSSRKLTDIPGPAFSLAPLLEKFCFMSFGSLASTTCIGTLYGFIMTHKFVVCGVVAIPLLQVRAMEDEFRQNRKEQGHHDMCLEGMKQATSMQPSCPIPSSFPPNIHISVGHATYPFGDSDILPNTLINYYEY